MNATEPADELARAEAVLAESGELMRLAAERSLTIRLTGSLAIRAVCPNHAPLLAALGRRPYRDIDLMAYSKQKREIATLFGERGYVLDPSIRAAQEFGIKRFVYSQPGTALNYPRSRQISQTGRAAPPGHSPGQGRWPLLPGAAAGLPLAAAAGPAASDRSGATAPGPPGVPAA